jgi:hypothetical protein
MEGIKTPTIAYRYLANLPEPARFERDNSTSSAIIRGERTALEKLINSRNSKQLNVPGQNALKTRIGKFKTLINYESRQSNARSSITPPDITYKKKMLAALKAYKSRTSWAKLTKKNAQYLAMKKTVLDDLPRIKPINLSKLVTNDELIRTYNNPMSEFRGGKKNKTRKTSGKYKS